MYLFHHNDRLVMFLNFDVLERVFEYLYVNHHIISFMMTCRTLYDVGVPHVLDIVNLRNAESVHSFSRFMLADPSRRCRHLKHLILDGTSDPWLPHVKEIFVQFLRHAQPLAHLDIVCCQALFSQDPRTAPLVSSLRHLRILGLKVMDPEHLWVVQALEAGLTDLTLTLTPRSLTQDPTDPAHYLSNLGPSLQKLRVGNCWFNASSGELRFPRVRTLEFEPVLTRTTDITPMVLSYPNLRCLHIQRPFGQTPDLDWDASRARNLAAPSWRSLDEVFSDVLTLFILGLHCPITRLTLLPFGRYQMEQFSAIMDVTQPIEFNLDHLSDVFRADADLITQAFRHPLSFTRLVWRIDFGRLSLYNLGELSFAKSKVSRRWSRRTFYTHIDRTCFLFLIENITRSS